MVHVQELRRRARSLLISSGTARPEYSADLILASALGLPRAALLWNDEEVAEDKLARAESLASRRASGVPLSYVLHEAEFYGYRFKVGRGVLIPRPETELLVEEALRLFPRGTEARFADVPLPESGGLLSKLGRTFAKTDGFDPPYRRLELK